MSTAQAALSSVARGVKAVTPQPKNLARQHRGFLLAWWLTLQALPFYPFHSGIPQPCDYLLLFLVTIPGLFALSRSFSSNRASFSVLFAFVAVVITVNVAWASALQSPQFLVTTAFYVFNATIFVGVVWQGRRVGPPFAAWTASALAVSLSVQCGLSLVFPDLALSGRLTLFFNNPNQLAYYVLAAATVVMMIGSVDGAKPSSRYLAFYVLAIAAYLSVRTYSRAAMLGVAALAFLWIARRPIALLLLMPGLLVAGSSDLATTDDVLLQSRLHSLTESNVGDYIEDRQLTRIVDHPLYVLIGAGEGEHLRFNQFGLELHSSLANVMFSYGVLGLITFILFLVTALRAPPSRTALLLSPALFYGLFHNGLRSRVFWLMLAMALLLRTSTGKRSATLVPPGARKSLGNAASPPRRVGLASEP